MVVISCQQVEGIDAKSLNILPILHDHKGDALHRGVPLAILNMDLAFLNVDRQEVRVDDRDLTEGCKRLIVSLGLLKNFRAPQQRLQVLSVPALVLV